MYGALPEDQRMEPKEPWVWNAGYQTFIWIERTTGACGAAGAPAKAVQGAWRHAAVSVGAVPSQGSGWPACLPPPDRCYPRLSFPATA